jgi:hypothetical protein
MKTFQLIRTTSFYLILLILNGCSAIISQQISVSTGTNLVLPKPHHSLIPTVKITPESGCNGGLNQKCAEVGHLQIKINSMVIVLLDYRNLS